MSNSGYYQNQSSGDGTWSELFGDVYSGIAVGLGHGKWFVEKKVGQGWNAIASLSGIAGRGGEADGQRSISDGAKNDQDSTNNISGDSKRGLKVVGVGYGRTGTYSLALALDELGFPTLHTQHLYENGEIFDHLVNNIFYKSIQDDEIIMGEPDFDLLLKRGFMATMDLPFALYFDQIHEQYPDCKFILTVRENSEVWFRSWAFLAKSISKPAQYTSFFVSHVLKLEHYMRWLFSVVNEDKMFLSHPHPLPPQNMQNSIASYEKHNQLVRDSIPSSQLLEYNVRQGWEPLCQFLEFPEVDCPSSQGIPFPKSNSTRALRWQTYSSFMAPMIVILFIIFSLFCLVFRKITGMPVIGWCKVQKVKFLRMASDSLDQRSKMNRGRVGRRNKTK